MNKVIVLENALAHHFMSVLRNKESKIADFRIALDRLSEMLVIQSVKDFPTEKVKIQTPLEETSCQVLKKSIVVVPILRAGLSMLSAFLNFLPDAQVGFIGQKRDEQTAKAFEYYRNFPDLNNKKIIIADPMLATGGSAVSTIESLLSLGAKLEDIQFTCVIASPEGVSAIREKFPNMHITTAALDRCLNEHKYIMPGLGDAGDLWTGTAG
jgi:uracil phosphoribosyltransferase